MKAAVDPISPRTAIVTGAASGIGRAVALALAADGATIVIADVRRGPLAGGEPTDQLIQTAGGRAIHVATDVGDEGACEDLMKGTIERYGRLDLLVNNARRAAPHSKRLLDTTTADWDALMAVNLRGPFILCRLAVKQMLGQDPRGETRGRIINMTSVHGFVGVPEHFAYAVGKGGLVQLTRQIALEHGRDGIICNAVAPGKIETGSPDDADESPQLTRHVRDRTPFARMGRPQDVAAAVAFLASDSTGFVSGINLPVDGGVLAS